jgi:hypothetical protein
MPAAIGTRLCSLVGCGFPIAAHACALGLHASCVRIATFWASTHPACEVRGLGPHASCVRSARPGAARILRAKCEAWGYTHLACEVRGLGLHASCVRIATFWASTHPACELRGLGPHASCVRIARPGAVRILRANREAWGCTHLACEVRCFGPVRILRAKSNVWPGR